jgi:hypothetical protein
VTVHQIGTTSLSNVANSRKSKAEAADKMFAQMMRHMIDAQSHRKTTGIGDTPKFPAWIGA